MSKFKKGEYKYNKYDALYTEYPIFEVIFNPQFKKAKDKYNIFTESVESVTLSFPEERRIYISFNDAEINNEETTIYDEFLKNISSIHCIQIKTADRSGYVTSEKEYHGKFVFAKYTELSYHGTLSFLAIFEIDFNKLND